MNDYLGCVQVPIGPAVSAQRLAELAQHSTPYIRERVATHPRTSEVTLRLLARDPNTAVAGRAISRLRG